MVLVMRGTSPGVEAAVARSTPGIFNSRTQRLLELTGLQLGVVRKKLGMVRKFNVVRTCKPALDHDQLQTTISFGLC